MGDDQRRAVLHDVFKRRLHEHFVFRVERRGRFIEQQHRRVLQDRARDRKALALAARQGHAALADRRVVALVEMGDKFSRRRAFGCGAHIFHGGVRAAIADIVHDAGAKDDRILRHQRETRAQMRRINIANINAIQHHRARLRIVETHQKLENRRLAGARRTDDGDRFARRHAEGKSLQRRRILTRRISECDVVEAHLATRRRRQRERLYRRDDLRLHREDFGNASGGARGGRNFAPHLREFAKCARAEHGVEHELRQQACRNAARQHILRAQPEHADDAGEGEENSDASQQRPRQSGVARGRIGLLDSRGEARHRRALGAEGLHGAHRAKVF